MPQREDPDDLRSSCQAPFGFCLVCFFSYDHFIYLYKTFFTRCLRHTSPGVIETSGAIQTGQHGLTPNHSLRRYQILWPLQLAAGLMTVALRIALLFLFFARLRIL